ncbi:MAG: transposase [Planctomycetes bacterium]|nr:transposase [Planctomycetota bacterium]
MSFDELAGLYRRRWEIETNFAHLKTTMGMDVLRQTVLLPCCRK